MINQSPLSDSPISLKINQSPLFDSPTSTKINKSLLIDSPIFTKINQSPLFDSPISPKINQSPLSDTPPHHLSKDKSITPVSPKINQSPLFDIKSGYASSLLYNNKIQILNTKLTNQHVIFMPQHLFLSSKIHLYLPTYSIKWLRFIPCVPVVLKSIKIMCLHIIFKNTEPY